MSSLSIPWGNHDLLQAECCAHRAQETALLDLFTAHGFHEVATPPVERYDLFLRAGSPLSESALIKTIDPDNCIAVLRPDSTAPIARLAATRLREEPLPLRLCYAQPVFRASTPQIRQAGIELIGAEGIDTDVEVLHLAATCLGKEAQFEISYAGIFTDLCRKAGLGARIEDIRGLVLRKNFAALGDILEPILQDDGPASAAAADLMACMQISGDPSLLDTLPDPQNVPFLSELRVLMSRLPHPQFSVDLGLVQSIEYYTGPVFQAYLPGAAAPVLRGGRYDNLLGALGRPAAAIGFAIDLDLLSEGE